MAKIDDDIATLDLDGPAFKALVSENMSLEEVDAAQHEYRLFLHMIRHNHGIELAPSKQADLFWHHHILDTSKYIVDCQALFGRYIHHYPYSGVFDEEDAQNQRDRFERSNAFMNSLKSTTGE